MVVVRTGRCTLSSACCAVPSGQVVRSKVPAVYVLQEAEQPKLEVPEENVQQPANFDPQSMPMHFFSALHGVHRLALAALQSH
jgi:hypothetical protein